MTDKKDRLDKAFLFIIGSSELVVTYVTLALGIKNQWENIPFLLIGIFFPFYISYIRGAITLDKIEERVRGWVYLIIGMFSYVGFVITITLQNWIGQTLFYICLLSGTLVTYFIFLKWTKKVFNISGIRFHYAYSGTALCSFGITFTTSLLLSLSKDLVGVDFSTIETIFSPEMFFWVTIVVGASLFILIMEKISRNLLFQTKLQFPELRKHRITKNNFVRAIYLGFSMLELGIENGSNTWFLLTQSFTFWVLGCTSWIMGFGIFPKIFFTITLVFAILGGVKFNKNPINFQNINKVVPSKSGYCAVIFVEICIILFAFPFLFKMLLGILGIILFTLIWIFIMWKIKK